jgi:serpin B
MIFSAMTVVFASKSRAQAPVALISDVSQSQTAFALDLYARLNKGGENLFFSPYSIYTALAMTYGGASGETAGQMAKALHSDASQAELATALGPEMQALNAGGKKGGYSLSVANALWGQTGADFKKSFLDLVSNVYAAGFQAVDFKTNAEKIRGDINSWVEQKTADKIKNLIGPGVLKAATRLVLVNAVYFKGNWAVQFGKAATKTEAFHVSSGKDVRVPLMNKQANFGYKDAQDFQILSMPYRGGDLSMVAFLPKQNFGLAAFEKSLSAAQMAGWLKGLIPRQVNVYFPKFKMTEQFSLGDQLKSMGMTDAFDGKTADFSGMNGKKAPDKDSLSISAVIHKAFVDVNEQGTEAAAATAVTMMGAMASIGRPISPPIFRADHPFLFMIRDNRSGAVLFLGRMANPTSSN